MGAEIFRIGDQIILKEGGDVDLRDHPRRTQEGTPQGLGCDLFSTRGMRLSWHSPQHHMSSKARAMGSGSSSTMAHSQRQGRQCHHRTRSDGGADAIFRSMVHEGPPSGLQEFRSPVRDSTPLFPRNPRSALTKQTGFVFYKRHIKPLTFISHGRTI